MFFLIYLVIDNGVMLYSVITASIYWAYYISKLFEYSEYGNSFSWPPLTPGCLWWIHKQKIQLLNDLQVKKHWISFSILPLISNITYFNKCLRINPFFLETIRAQNLELDSLGLSHSSSLVDFVQVTRLFHNSVCHL